MTIGAIEPLDWGPGKEEVPQNSILDQNNPLGRNAFVIKLLPTSERDLVICL